MSIGSFYRGNARGKLTTRALYRQDKYDNTYLPVGADFFARPLLLISLPPTTVLQALEAGVTRVTNRVDVYLSDTTTLWAGAVGVIDGSVSIDATREERRTASLVLDNSDGSMRSRPGGFWYDKVLKLFRGIIYYDTTGSPVSWETQLGEFYIDDIDHDFGTVSVSVRDGTKKLLAAKFAQSTEFAANEPIEEIIRAIAISGGLSIDKIDLPLTGVSTSRKFLFDRTTERWKAITEIASAYNYDVYFTAAGKLTMTPFADPADPAVSPSQYTFEVGGRNVANPNIELLKDATTAEWWSKNFEVASGGGTQTIETDPQHVRSGKYALKQINVAGSGNSWASKSISVNPGEVWNVSAWSKAVLPGGAVPGSSRYFRVLFGPTEGFARFDAGVILVDIGGSNAAFTGEYTQVTGTVTVPAGAQWMRLAPYAWGIVATDYTAWWDDFSAERIDPLIDTKGNLVSYRKRTGSTRIYNHIVVTGEVAGQVLVYAEAENNNVDSPTHIDPLTGGIGRRTYFYTSAFISTVAQAQEVADRFLAVHALEQFEIALESLVIPYLDANIIVEFEDPEGSSTDPTRYLLSDLTIPLLPGAMQANVRRVTLVG